MWKYDTGIRSAFFGTRRSLAGQGFAGSEENDLAIFGVSRQNKSEGFFSMQAAREAARQQNEREQTASRAWSAEGRYVRSDAGNGRKMLEKLQEQEK
ncbi:MULTISPECIES: hypothetical protein [Burkholderiaceae]|uniref:hypothetical protein n=1 Tax=Burkholderiaceae TaxID=119060 RepID=UPI00138A0FA6|nr:MULTISPECIES: hypothetical protein [Burkholderiaceae]